MSADDAFARIIMALHEAALDPAQWPVASALIDEACGVQGNGLLIGAGPRDNIQASFVGLYYRGERRTDFEREYLEDYHPRDERVPRVRALPAGHLAHATAVYTTEELRTSATYNEMLCRAQMQDGVNVRLDGLDGSHLSWGLAGDGDRHQNHLVELGWMARTSAGDWRTPSLQAAGRFRNWPCSRLCCRTSGNSCGSSRAWPKPRPPTPR